MKLRVKTCCGCWDLRTGTLIIGICGILFSIGGVFTHTSGVENIEDETTRQEVKVGIGYSYVFIIINALLIYGAAKESRYFLLPWLIYIAIGAGVLTGLSIIALFASVLVAFILLLFSAGMWYSWLCVLSFYHELNPTNIPPTMYSDGSQVTSMPPNIVTFAAQPPTYTEVIKGPEAV